MTTKAGEEVACRVCTFLNVVEAPVCAMCGYPLKNGEEAVVPVQDSTRTRRRLQETGDDDDDEGILEVWEGPTKASVSVNDEALIAWEEQKMPARNPVGILDKSSSSDSQSTSSSENSDLVVPVPVPAKKASVSAGETIGDEAIVAWEEQKMPVPISVGILDESSSSNSQSTSSSENSDMLSANPVLFADPFTAFIENQYQDDMNQMLRAHAPPPQRRFTPSFLQSKKRKRKMPPSSHLPAVSASKPPPMRAGERNHKTLVSFRNNIDVARSDLTAPQRTELLQAAFDLTASAANRWRIAYDKQRLKSSSSSSSSSLWNMIVMCAKDPEQKSVRVNAGQHKPSFFSDQEWDLLLKHIKAYYGQATFRAQLNAIKPVAAADANNDLCLDCPICCERYLFEHFVFCQGQEKMHPLCQKCFVRYATETIQAGSISQIPCADPTCNSLFATETAKAHLSEWDQLRMSEREEERNNKVALAAKAVLKCACGAVGIVTEEDVGNGCIVCPGASCGQSYCVRCGNEWHEGKPCPPPAETVKWLSKKTRACPNCHTPIEKNGGCDHMFCRPPEGCGHRFNWSQAVAPPSS